MAPSEPFRFVNGVRRAGAASAWIALAMASGCGLPSSSDDGDPSGGTSDTVAAAVDIAQVCDGSEELNLWFSFISGEPAYSFDPVMARSGNRFLAVDGQCRFYAYDGGDYPLGVWTAVVSAELGEHEFSTLADTLGLDGWSGTPSIETTAPADVDESASTFFLLGETSSCYPCGDVGTAMTLSAFDAITWLYTLGAPYVSEELEVLVLPPVGSSVESPWWIEWGAMEEPAAFLPAGGEAPSALGMVVADGDVAWFQQAQQDFQTRSLDTFTRDQNGIHVGDPVEYELFVQSIIPGLPTMW